MNITRRKSRAFTLLELMIGIVLITLMSGLIGIKMHKAIQRKTVPIERGAVESPISRLSKAGCFHTR